MQQYFIYVSIVLGTAMLLFPKQLARTCSRRGQAFWRTDRGALFMRIMGVGWVLFGVLFLYRLGFPFRGPGEFKAANEAREYLVATYGNSDGEASFDATPEVPDRTIVIVDYKFGGHSGSLRAKWQGEKYEFSELQKK
jgi:hypothetical protein